MAITAADLQVKLSTTGADAVKRDLAGVGQAVEDTGNKSSRMGSTIATAFRWGVIGAATGVIAGSAAALTSWVMGASSLAEAQTKVNAVYGQSANVINKWAKTTSKAFGITETSALATAGTFGNLFVNMGFTQDQAAGMSTEIVELSADMASFNDVSQPQVIEALTSAFVGEYDALQRLGVNISAAAVEQYALNNGIWDGVGAMTDAERATAVYGLTMEQTAIQQGDVARNADSMANQLRILGATFSELGARIGTVFLPAATAVVGWAIDAVDWMSRLADTFGAGGFGAVIDSITADLAGLSIDLAGWTVNVGAPAAINLLWDAAGAIASALTSVVVSLTGWTASLDGAEIVAGSLDLAGEIAEFVAANPMVVPIAAAVLTLMFFGAPGIIIAGLTAAAIALAVTGEIPDEVAIPAAHLTIALMAFGIELVDLTTEIQLAIAGELVALTAEIPLLALEVINYDIALIDLPAAIAMAVVDEIGDYSLAGVMIGLEIASWSIRLSGLTAAVASAVVDEIGDYSLAGVTIGLEVTAIVEATVELAEGTSIGPTVQKLLEAAIPGGDIIFDLIAKFNPDVQLGADIDIAALVEAAIKAALPAGGIIISGIKVTFDLFDTDSGEPIEWEPVEPLFPNIENDILSLGRLTDAANAARDAIGGVFSGGAGGEGGRGAVGAGAGAGITSTITSVIASLTQLQSAAQVARAAMASMTAAVTAGMASIRSAFTAGMAAAVAAVTAGMAAARAATAAGAASMASSMVAGMAVFRAAVTSGMAAAVAAVRAGIAAMVAAASAGRGQMMSAGLGIGAALGQGIAAGIRGQIGAVAAAAAALVSAAVSAAKSAGAISSPSRVMQEQVGQMLGLGAIVGVQDMYPGMNAAMAGLVQVPTVPLIAGGGLNGEINGGGSGGINVTVIVQGNVTTERELTAHLTREIGTAIVNNQIRYRTAVGVTP